jgi:hypothetical protein
MSHFQPIVGSIRSRVTKEGRLVSACQSLPDSLDARWLSVEGGREWPSGRMSRQ